MLYRLGSLFLLTLALINNAYAQQLQLDIKIGYLEIKQPAPPTLSNLDQVPEDQGLKGGELGITDNNTTGKFLGQNYTLETVVLEEDDDGLKEASTLLNQSRLLLINANAKQLAAIAQLPEALNAILFNVSSRDVSLRNEACSANVFHTIPSHIMLTDALAQFAVKKRWTNWVMIAGALEADKAYAAALERSAAKFRINLAERKEWVFDADMRRNAAQEVPLFTQDFPDHDMLVIADEANDFARYVMFNTWLPRPIGGADGVSPAAWSASVEQHGAAQLQSRFQGHAGRQMRPLDYATWVAVRSVGEAVIRTKSDKVEDLRRYMLSDQFQMAGFKGRALTYRNWNGQLRQPIPLTHPSAVVALAPVEGFLHQFNELDTLGLDRPESKCAAFGDKQ